MKKIRNTIARMAILRKGGVHNKSNKAKRQKHKQKLQKQIRADKFSPYSFIGRHYKLLFVSLCLSQRFS